jgi:hypothetical protein
MHPNQACRNRSRHLADGETKPSIGARAGGATSEPQWRPRSLWVSPPKRRDGPAGGCSATVYALASAYVCPVLRVTLSAPRSTHAPIAPAETPTQDSELRDRMGCVDADTGC